MVTMILVAATLAIAALVIVAIVVRRHCSVPEDCMGECTGGLVVAPGMRDAREVMSC